MDFYDNERDRLKENIHLFVFIYNPRSIVKENIMFLNNLHYKPAFVAVAVHYSTEIFLLIFSNNLKMAMILQLS